MDLSKVSHEHTFAQQNLPNLLFPTTKKYTENLIRNRLIRPKLKLIGTELIIFCISFEMPQDATETNGKTHEDNNTAAANGHIQLDESPKENADAKQDSNTFIKIEKNANRKKRDTSADRSLKVIPLFEHFPIDNYAVLKLEFLVH